MRREGAGTKSKNRYLLEDSLLTLALRALEDSECSSEYVEEFLELPVLSRGSDHRGMENGIRLCSHVADEELGGVSSSASGGLSVERRGFAGLEAKNPIELRWVLGVGAEPAIDVSAAVGVPGLLEASS